MSANHDKIGFVVPIFHDRGKVMNEIGTELDSNVNFNVNKVLKQKFEELCKKNQSNMARELKAFMTKAVLDNKLGNNRDIDNS